MNFADLLPRSHKTPVTGASQKPFIRSSDVHNFIQPVEKLILQYPAVALASAFVVGVTLAWWIKRK
jgi:hypothetical protein